MKGAIAFVKNIFKCFTKKGNEVTIEIKIKMETEPKENVTIDVKCMTKGELIDAIASSSKLTKADAGRALDAAIEAHVHLKGFKAMEPEL